MRVWWLTCSAVLWIACARPPGFRVEGSARFEGEVDHAGIVVVLAEQSTATDSDGHFAFERVEEGAWELTVASADSMEGSITQTVAVSDAPQTLEPILLHPVGRLSGRVVNAQSGQPIEGALVMSEARIAVSTDGEGRFSLNGVRAGRGSISVSRLAYEPVVVRVSPKRGEAVDVGDLVLKPREGDGSLPSLAGTVELPDGTLAAGVQVRLTVGTSTLDTATDQNGRFAYFNLMNGETTLSFTKGTYDAELSHVLVVPGTSGLVMRGELAPLDQLPVTLTDGERLGRLDWPDAVMPDGVVGRFATPDGWGLDFVPFDGGVGRTLISGREGGFAGFTVTQVGSDGTTLALSSVASASSLSQLLLVSTRLDGRQQLSGSAQAYWDPVRPQNEILYYEADATGVGGAAQWALMRLGTQPVNLGPASFFATVDHPGRQLISPDPQTNRLRRLHFDGTRVDLPATASSGYQVSPDGSQLIASEAGGRVALVDVRTATRVELGTLGSIRWVLKWSPDEVVVMTSDSVIAISTATSVPRRVATDVVYSWELGPDGCVVGHTNVPGAVDIVDYATGTSIPFVTSMRLLALKANAAFAIDDPGLVGRGWLVIGTVRRIDRVVEDVIDSALGVAPDGSRVAVGVDSPEGRLFVYDTRTGERLNVRVPLEGSLGLFEFSPRATRLSFVVQADRGLVLMVYTLATHELRALALDASLERWIDDDRLLLNTASALGTREVRLVRLP